MVNRHEHEKPPPFGKIFLGHFFDTSKKQMKVNKNAVQGQSLL